MSDSDILKPLKEGIPRQCSYCGAYIYGDKEYGEHKRNCPKRPK